MTKEEILEQLRRQELYHRQVLSTCENYNNDELQRTLLSLDYAIRCVEREG